MFHIKFKKIIPTLLATAALALPASGAYGLAAKLPARAVLNFLRAVPDLLWAAIAVLAAGIGPLAGVIAPPPGWTPLLADLAQRARQPLQEALGKVKHLPREQARALRPLVLLAHLALAQVEVVASAGDAVLHQRLLPTPWRKAWIAQRVAWGWLR